jgi:alpha-tubulin suppressor-like RCC1 family protein
LALLSNGTVMAWGRNADGQLGNGSHEQGDVPVPVPGLSGVTAVAASYGISMALLSNGTVMDWGENDSGQLGDGTANEDTPTPVQVFRLSEVIAIATGGSYGLALLKNGTVMTWGSGGGRKQLHSCPGKRTDRSHRHRGRWRPQSSAAEKWHGHGLG